MLLANRCYDAIKRETAYSSSIIRNFILYLHIRHIWDGLKWLMFPWITSNCLNDIRTCEWTMKWSILTEFNEFLPLFGSYEWYSFASSFCLLTCMYVIIFCGCWRITHFDFFTSFIRHERSIFYFHAVTHEEVSV